MLLQPLEASELLQLNLMDLLAHQRLLLRLLELLELLQAE